MLFCFANNKIIRKDRKHSLLRPAVLDDPVVLALLVGAVAHGEDTVVEFGAAALGLIVDSRAEEGVCVRNGRQFRFSFIIWLIIWLAQGKRQIPVKLE